jgi:chromosome segregation protein
LRGEGEDTELTLAEAAALTGLSEETLRHRLAQLATRANGGPPPGTSTGAELEPIGRSEVTVSGKSSQQQIDLALDLVARLEAQAVEISRLSAMASKAEALDQALAAEREERERLDAELEEARSELRSLKSRLGGLQARQHVHGGLETELVRTQAELAAAKARLADTQASWRSLFSEKLKQQRERRRDDEDKRREALSRELDEVREALETAQRRIAELEERDAERVALQERLAIAQRDLGEARERVAELAQSRNRRGLSLAQRLGFPRSRKALPPARGRGLPRKRPSPPVFPRT